MTSSPTSEDVGDRRSGTSRLIYDKAQRTIIREDTGKPALKDVGDRAAALEDQADDRAQAAYWHGAYERMATRNHDLDRELEDLRRAVLDHIPMDYLQRHDALGATGPTSALNLRAAMRDYASDRWKLIDRLAALSQANAERERSPEESK